jgi:hypothetical protein
LEELKFMVRRGGHEALKQHLLEAEEYREFFCDGELKEIAAASGFHARR